MMWFCFFFQAEDGIRDLTVTGVQTCALPISKIRATFDEASRQAVSQFEQQIKEVVQPQVTSAEEAVHRLAGSRSVLDVPLTMQQGRIRNTADEAFAESLARFRGKLGRVGQILQDSLQSITYCHLTELGG